VLDFLQQKIFCIYAFFQGHPVGYADDPPAASSIAPLVARK
jgi:hypothetical protein